MFWDRSVGSLQPITPTNRSQHSDPPREVNAVAPAPRLFLSLKKISEATRVGNLEKWGKHPWFWLQSFWPICNWKCHSQTFGGSATPPKHMKVFLGIIVEASALRHVEATLQKRCISCRLKSHLKLEKSCAQPGCISASVKVLCNFDLTRS